MKMKKLLCPRCKTGLESLKLDVKEPMCPYILFHNGEECIKFEEIKNANNQKMTFVKLLVHKKHFGR